MLPAELVRPFGHQRGEQQPEVEDQAIKPDNERVALAAMTLVSAGDWTDGRVVAGTQAGSRSRSMTLSAAPLCNTQ